MECMRGHDGKRERESSTTVAQAPAGEQRHSCLVGDDRRAASEEMHDRPAGFIHLCMGPSQCKQEQMLPMQPRFVSSSQPDFHDDHASRPAGRSWGDCVGRAGQGKRELASIKQIAIARVRLQIESRVSKECLGVEFVVHGHMAYVRTCSAISSKHALVNASRDKAIMQRFWI